jgi:hypothetical protein
MSKRFSGLVALLLGLPACVDNSHRLTYGELSGNEAAYWAGTISDREVEAEVGLTYDEIKEITIFHMTEAESLRAHFDAGHYTEKDQLAWLVDRDVDTALVDYGHRIGYDDFEGLQELVGLFLKNESGDRNRRWLMERVKDGAPPGRRADDEECMDRVRHHIAYFKGINNWARDEIAALNPEKELGLTREEIIELTGLDRNNCERLVGYKHWLPDASKDELHLLHHFDVRPEFVEYTVSQEVTNVRELFALRVSLGAQFYGGEISVTSYMRDDGDHPTPEQMRALIRHEYRSSTFWELAIEGYSNEDIVRLAEVGLYTNRKRTGPLNYFLKLDVTNVDDILGYVRQSTPEGRSIRGIRIAESLDRLGLTFDDLDFYDGADTSELHAYSRAGFKGRHVMEELAEGGISGDLACSYVDAGFSGNREAVELLVAEGVSREQAEFYAGIGITDEHSMVALRRIGFNQEAFGKMQEIGFLTPRDDVYTLGGVLIAFDSYRRHEGTLDAAGVFASPVSLVD